MEDKEGFVIKVGNVVRTENGTGRVLDIFPSLLFNKKIWIVKTKMLDGTEAGHIKELEAGLIRGIVIP